MGEPEKTDAEAVNMQELMTAAAKGEDVVEEVVEEEVVEEPIAEELDEVVEEVVEEPVKPEPDDNRERSKLGRKVEALWERMDEQKTTFEKLSDVLTAMMEKEKSEDGDELITRSMAEKLAEEKAQKILSKQDDGQKRYEKGYYEQLVMLGTDYDADEFDEIKDVMMNEFNVKHSDDPKYDAMRNFKDAEIRWLKKEKKSLPKRAKPKGKIATTSAAKVAKKDNPLPKLDAAATNYINWVKRNRGDDAAKKLRESA